MDMRMATKYAPAERLGTTEINKQIEVIKSNKIFKELLDALGVVAAIINAERQIVYYNETLVKYLNITNPETIIGQRPGEVFNCIHSKDEVGGCGTSEACRYCGAVNAILESEKTGKKATKECRITSLEEGEHFFYDLQFTSTPILIENDLFKIISLMDISEQKRKHVLERIFFHDVLNTAGGLNGFIECLQDYESIEEMKGDLSLVSKISKKLIDEIIGQRDLINAENNELGVYNQEILIKSFMEEIAAQIGHHIIAENKQIITNNINDELIITSDRHLLSRVLINMLKNALEATPENGVVTFGYNIIDQEIEFYIQNSKKMPREIELQVFQRSFSTKGANRGIGTYSMKLIGEKYLKGKVYFTTSDDEGTKFFIKIPIKAEN